MDSDPVTLTYTIFDSFPIAEIVFSVVVLALAFLLAVRRRTVRSWLLFGASVFFAAKYAVVFALSGHRFSGHSGFWLLHIIHYIPTTGFLLLGVFIALSLRSTPRA